MELTQIRYFLEAAKTQHITKSAEALHIAQPALTKAIHKLQEELGVPLFMHIGRNIVLTVYGEYLRDRLLPVIASLDNAASDLKQMADTENKTIRLSVLAASTLVTHAIIEYKKQFPDITFHVLQNPENEFFDIEITTNLLSEDSGADRFVCTENIFLAVPDVGKYKVLDSIDLSEVRDEGFISLLGSKQLRGICDKFCRQAGFEARIIFESDSPYAVKNMISANLGIGFWPEFTWGDINSSDVKLLKITNPDCRRDIIITYKPTKADCSHSERFYNFLTDYFREKRSSSICKKHEIL